MLYYECVNYHRRSDRHHPISSSHLLRHLRRALHAPVIVHARNTGASGDLQTPQTRTGGSSVNTRSAPTAPKPIRRNASADANSTETGNGYGTSSGITAITVSRRRGGLNCTNTHPNTTSTSTNYSYTRTTCRPTINQHREESYRDMNSTNTITGNLWPSTRNPETATPTTNTNHHYPDSLPQFRPFAIPVAPSEPVASYSATYTAASLHTALRSYRQRRLNIEKLKHAGADTSQHEQQTRTAPVRHPRRPEPGEPTVPHRPVHPRRTRHHHRGQARGHGENRL